MVAPAEGDVQAELLVEEDLPHRVQTEVAQNAESQLGHIAVSRLGREVNALGFGRRPDPSTAMTLLNSMPKRTISPSISTGRTPRVPLGSPFSPS